jgi:hypothetical protein
MDLSQTKLSRKEWESIELPVAADEAEILHLIHRGYNDVNIRYNKNLSLFSYSKIEITSEMQTFLYEKYFSVDIQKMLEKYGKNSKIVFDSSSSKIIKRMKSADNIRIQNIDASIKENKSAIFEFILLDTCENILKNYSKKNITYSFHLYTLIQLHKATIANINIHVIEFIDALIAAVSQETTVNTVIENAYDFIEKNPNLFKYEDKSLFSHQQELFTICKQTQTTPKLILYSAPTGTGKTLSPIGLANGTRIIFVCVARHIGLALAKSAIFMEKKVAFAFGCSSAADIRLHYFAAVDYVKDRRSGGIAKVDNDNGSKVEIMICDVYSYLTAMYYMLAFNPADSITTYWDEPTITMDYESHELHSIIHRNWVENKIPNMVLSCATLPQQEDIMPIIQDFRSRFQGADIHTITSFQFKKSISILNKDGYCVLPHMFYSEFDKMMECVEYCENHKTLLRYFDLCEIVRFIVYLNTQDYIEDTYSIDSYFESDIANINMNSLKNYYLFLLKHACTVENWATIRRYMTTTQKRKFDTSKYVFKKSQSMEDKSSKVGSTSELVRQNSMANPGQEPQNSTIKQNSGGILITTADAYTLTDGPTIFLAGDINKIGQFYIQQSNIPTNVFQILMARITKNGELLKRIQYIENEIATKETKTTVNEDGNNTSTNFNRESGRLCNESEGFMAEINKLRREIRLVSIDPVYIPNTTRHQEIWTPTCKVHDNAFIPNIDETSTKKIMGMVIDNHLKVLLLLGIGMFIENPNVEYMEIMKHLADTQRLFIIIAASDYIYGTNYQFCHGFIGKDLTNMTQQKTLQAMGRIGRNNIQQEYTIRFRDDGMIDGLFHKPSRNIEAENMCRLFCTDNE